jgi:hypothetical protein
MSFLLSRKKICSEGSERRRSNNFIGGIEHRLAIPHHFIVLANHLYNNFSFICHPEAKCLATFSLQWNKGTLLIFLL